MVYAIGQRLRELGIRMALGATPPNVFALVRLKVIGLVLGLIAAFVGVRLITSLLFGVAAHDSLVFFTVATMLAACERRPAVAPEGRSDPAAQDYDRV